MKAFIEHNATAIMLVSAVVSTALIPLAVSVFRKGKRLKKKFEYYTTPLS